ncbi:MAG: Hpt domain-containing protein [Thermodesulfobacteriota bacterium]
MDGHIETGHSGLELNEALDRAMGDGAFLRTLLEDYFQKLPGIMESLDTAVREGDTPRLKQTAHSLKGMSANLGCALIQQLVMRLEAAAQNSEPRVCIELLGELDEAIRRTRKLVDEIDWSVYD